MNVENAGRFEFASSFERTNQKKKINVDERSDGPNPVRETSKYYRGGGGASVYRAKTNEQSGMGYKDKGPVSRGRTVRRVR